MMLINALRKKDVLLMRKVNTKPVKATKTCSNPECGKTTVSIEKNFYAVKDTLAFPDGRLPFCKQCCYDSWEKDGLPAFLNTLRLLDKPLLEDKFEMSKGDYKLYIKNMQSLWDRNDELVFTDSTMFTESKRIMEQKNNSINLEELSEEDFKDLQEYWGLGYTEEQYIWVTAEFAKYGYEGDKLSPSLETIIREICLTQLDIRIRREKGQDVDKQIKMLNDLMASAGIKPTQESGTGNAELDSFSKWIRHIEDDRPIAEPNPEWKDVDGIRKAIVTFFLHPWARLWNKQKESPYYEEAKEYLEEYTVYPRDIEFKDGRDLDD